MQETSHSAEAGLTQATSSEPVYEVGFHLVPTLSESEVTSAVEAIRALVGKVIIKEEVPRKLTLAYIIERSKAGRREKFAEAYFGFIKFEAEKEQIPAIAEALRADQNVLRHLLIETVREDVTTSRRAVFASDRLEGETIKKPQAAEEKPAEVSEEELDKSIDALVG